MNSLLMVSLGIFIGVMVTIWLNRKLYSGIFNAVVIHHNQITKAVQMTVDDLVTQTFINRKHTELIIRNAFAHNGIVLRKEFPLQEFKTKV